ncbi:DNA gyrase inhibitor YacG [Alphaproteobacteria bacterium SO-S41]|nr:DNA gyrase inhibitor YacG [Alphaproteobacteria bacterium SO-S41]
MTVAARACAICGKPQTDKFKPFCSARCADVDLNRWLKGSYVVPGKPLGEDDEAESAPDESAI